MVHHDSRRRGAVPQRAPAALAARHFGAPPVRPGGRTFLPKTHSAGLEGAPLPSPLFGALGSLLPRRPEPRMLVSAPSYNPCYDGIDPRRAPSPRSPRRSRATHAYLCGAVLTCKCSGGA